MRIMLRYSIVILLGIFSQISEDDQGNIWIFGRDSEIARFDVKSKKFTTFMSHKQKFSFENIYVGS